MRKVIIDSSCIFDMQKCGLLISMFDLPYDFLMPRFMFENEILTIAPEEKNNLKTRGLKTVDPEERYVLQALEYREQNSGLSLYDCFALALAKEIPDSILLTGDKDLRRTASDAETEVHGVLWIIDEILNNETATTSALYEALSIFKNDKLIFLPIEEIEKRLTNLKHSP